MKIRITLLLLVVSIYASAQIKIGNNPSTINSNSLLEMESTNKGFLPPRVALTSLGATTPLTGTVPAGMLVYSSGGTLQDGFYYWNGSEWKLVSTSTVNTVVKTANATITKSETIVLASNDITLTLPTVTSADNGLQITVKNIGTYLDLITVQGNSGATIDDAASRKLTRFCGQTFVAYNGNWVVKDKNKLTENLLDVNANSSWTTIAEAVEFLGEHMTGPVVIRLDEEAYEISETIVIDLPFAVTFQGLSYGSSTIVPATGIAGKPLFRCVTDCYFKMLEFNANELTNYGTLVGEDAIRYVGTDTYNEVKDCTFDRFYNAIIDSADNEIWVFECDISNAVSNGILVHGNVPGATVKVAETDFTGCKRGINLSKGSNAVIQLASGGYYNANGTDTAIVCQPATFTTYQSISITGNSWNNTGRYIEGFDFTRSDGRDRNVILESNAGMGDKKPNCFINVLNNTATTVTMISANTWYKADWGSNTFSTTCKWGIASNRITYQPTNKRDGWFNIAGNLSVNNSNRVISIGIVKNGNTAVRYGETTLRITTSNQPFQFSFVVYIEDISPNDYFEIYTSSTASWDIIKVQDIQWLAQTE